MAKHKRLHEITFSKHQKHTPNFFLFFIFIRLSSRHSTEQTNPEKYNRHTQPIMNLATQIAAKELLISKCLVQFINTPSNI